MSDCKYKYKFGPFLLCPRQYELLRDGEPMSITPKAFDLLVVLVENHGTLVEKADLLRAVWHETFVEEGNLSVMICLLRKMFGEEHKYIQTVSKHGYRFVGEVSTMPADFLEIPPEATPPSGEFRLAPEDREVFPQTTSALPSLTAPARRRFHSTRSVSVFVSATLAAGVLASVLWVNTKVKTRPAAASEIKSIAVLPFETLSGKLGDEYISLGLADALITKLGKLEKILTRPTRAIQKYQNASQDPRAAGREQGVDAVVDGYIQRSGDRVRITAELIRVADGAQLWGETFDEEFSDLFAVEDTVSTKVARSIQLRVGVQIADEHFSKLSAPNSEAYRAYMTGRYFWNERTGKGLEKSIEYLQQAINLDPMYAKAYAGLADSYAMLGLYTVRPPNEAFPRAAAAANKALALDPELAEAHATLGFVHFYYDWDGAAAEREFNTAIRIDPNYAMAHSWRGFNLVVMGQPSEAVEEAKRAQEADPVSPIVGTNAAWVYFLAGQDDRARGILKRVIELDPNFPRAHFRLGNVYEHMSKYPEAIAEYEKAVSLSDGDTYYLGYLGHAYAVSKMHARADKSLRKLEELSSMRYVPPFSIAMIYSGLGDKDHAFEFFKNASADRSTSMAYIKLDPALVNLHSDPRFATLVQQTSF